jgi:hypothetical protein
MPTRANVRRLWRTEGEVDLTAGMGLVKRILLCSSPPSIVGDVAMGGWVYDNVERGEPSGVVRAFDYSYGRVEHGRWTSAGSIADAATPGEQYPGTINVWSPISADPALGLVYLPTGNETPDFFGGRRLPSSDVYSSSVIAVMRRETPGRFAGFPDRASRHLGRTFAAQPLLVGFPETPARHDARGPDIDQAGRTFVRRIAGPAVRWCR